MTWESLEELQRAIREWNERNFPNTIEGSRTNCFTGIVEEVGELAHVDLKERQGIRGYDDKAKAMVERIDAIGDILIYLIAYADYRNLDVSHVLCTTAKKVLARDWLAEKGEKD